MYERTCIITPGQYASMSRTSSMLSKRDLNNRKVQSLSYRVFNSSIIFRQLLAWWWLYELIYLFLCNDLLWTYNFLTLQKKWMMQRGGSNARDMVYRCLSRLIAMDLQARMNRTGAFGKEKFPEALERMLKGNYHQLICNNTIYFVDLGKFISIILSSWIMKFNVLQCYPETSLVHPRPANYRFFLENQYSDPYLIQYLLHSSHLTVNAWIVVLTCSP